MNRSEFFGFTIIFVLIIILILHSTSLNTTDNNYNYNNKVFENQFVQFNYSSNLYLVDKSNNTSIFVVIYDGNPSNNDAIGTIFLGEANKTAQMNPFEETTISGYDAIEENQGDPGAVIFLNNNTGLYILVNPSYESDVNTIINSMVIKKEPTEITSNKLFYELNQ